MRGISGSEGRSRRRAPLKNQVVVSNQVPSTPIRLTVVRRLAEQALRLLQFEGVLLSLTFVSDAAIRRLNKCFLKHDGVTDVLAFPFSEISQRARLGKVRRQFLGEVVIAPHQANVQAKKYQVTFAEELARYLYHGILHLAGDRDQTRAERRKMREAEDVLLAKFARSSRRILSRGD